MEEISYEKVILQKNRNSNSEMISPNCGAQSLLRERQTFTLERREKKSFVFSGNSCTKSMFHYHIPATQIAKWAKTL